MSLDGESFGRSVIDAVKGYVARAAAPLLARIEKAEARQAEVEATGARIAEGLAECKAVLESMERRQAERDARMAGFALAETVDRHDEAHRGLIAELMPLHVARAMAALPEPKAGEPGKSVTVADVAPLIAAEVAKAAAAQPPSLTDELAALLVERVLAKLPKLKDGVGLAGAVIDRDGALILTLTEGGQVNLGRIVGRDGEGVKPEAITEMVRSEVAKAIEHVKALGPSVDPDLVPKLVERRVAEAVAALPKPESVTPDDLRPLVAAEVARAVSALPDPKPGEPGRSITVADVAPMIAEALAKAVAALPKPQDGTSVDPETVKAWVGDMVSAAFATVERPRDGEDADPEETRKMVAAQVAERGPEMLAPLVERAFSALPDIAGAVTAEVSRQVADLPKPEIVSKGVEVLEIEIAAAVEAELLKRRPADLAAVKAMVVERVTEAVGALPKPEKGEAGGSITAEDLAPMVRAVVAEAVSALPAPPKGDPGPMGKLPPARAWEDRVHREGDVVTFAGSLYQAARDTGKAPGHEDWTCLAARGADGRTPVVRGLWTAEGAYSFLDVVALEGGSFIARKDDPGPCPGEGWQLLAMRGKAGKPGPSLKGDPGRAGPKVERMSIDDQGMLTLINADGSTATCDLYPLLAKLGS